MHSCRLYSDKYMTINLNIKFLKKLSFSNFFLLYSLNKHVNFLLKNVVKSYQISNANDFASKVSSSQFLHFARLLLIR